LSCKHNNFFAILLFHHKDLSLFLILSCFQSLDEILLCDFESTGRAKFFSFSEDVGEDFFEHPRCI
jgi:hypothetical protein